jgi:hypothetical protein
MIKRVNKIFWTVFILFCFLATSLLEIFNLIDLSSMGIVEDAIFACSLLVSGLCIQYWMKKNPAEVKEYFKL